MQLFFLLKDKELNLNIDDIKNKMKMTIFNEKIKIGQKNLKQIKKNIKKLLEEYKYIKNKKMENKL